MGELFQDKLIDGLATTTTGATGQAPVVVGTTVRARAIDLRDMSSYSIFADLTGGTAGATMKIQVTTDPAGVNGWADAAYRAPGGGAYGTAAIALAAGAKGSYFLDPTDNVIWIRVTVSANDGTLTVHLMGEQ